MTSLFVRTNTATSFIDITVALANAIALHVIFPIARVLASSFGIAPGPVFGLGLAFAFGLASMHSLSQEDSLMAKSLQLLQ